MELILLPIMLMAVAIFWLAVERDELRRQISGARAREVILDGLLRRLQRRGGPGDFPPGTIPVELALAVHEEWRRAGYHLVGDTRVVLRLLSIAHRVMCEHRPHSLAPSHYNDGDRSAPAKVQCRSLTGDCTFPACACEAIEPPLPPISPMPEKHR